MKRTPTAFTFANYAPENIWDTCRTLPTAKRKKQNLEVMFPDTQFIIQKYQKYFYVTGKLSIWK